MRILLSFLVLLVMTIMSIPSHAALNNENNSQVLCVPLGSPSADDVVLAGVNAGSRWKVSSVYLLNEALIAASNTDYVQIELKKGATVVAEIDSRAAHEDGIAANTAEALNLVSAEALMAANQVLSVNYNETDSGSAVALTGAVLCLKYSVQ